MYRKILVPIDGSPTAQRGLQEALSLAQATRATLLLLHVIDTMPVPLEMVTATTWENVAEGLRKHGEAILERARRSAAELGVAAETKLAEVGAERVADTIVAQAREAGCDLVVMGTHGRRGFSHVVLGSDAERVVRRCSMPVLLVRHPDAPRG